MIEQYYYTLTWPWSTIIIRRRSSFQRTVFGFTISNNRRTPHFTLIRTILPSRWLPYLAFYITLFHIVVTHISVNFWIAFKIYRFRCFNDQKYAIWGYAMFPTKLYSLTCKILNDWIVFYKDLNGYLSIISSPVNRHLHVITPFGAKLSYIYISSIYTVGFTWNV